MGAELFHTWLGWVAFALFFGVIPIYAACRTKEFFTHVDQHLSKRSDRVTSGMAVAEQSHQIKIIARA